MKKFILSLGTLASAVAPIAAVVACGTDSETGLPTLTAEESTELVRSISNALGIWAAIPDNSFQIKVTKFSITEVEFTLEKLTTGNIAIPNLVKSGTALSFSKGETLKFHLEFNANKDGLTTKTFTLSNSTDENKNGEYVPETTTLDIDGVWRMAKSIFKNLDGINETITLTNTHKNIIINKLGTSAISAEVVFRDYTNRNQAWNDLPYPATWDHVSLAKLIAKTNHAKATFDFTLELTSGSGQLRIFGETENLTLATGGKATIHLVGTMGTSGYKLTTRTSTMSNKTITLNEAGSKKLARALYSAALY